MHALGRGEMSPAGLAGDVIEHTHPRRQRLVVGLKGQRKILSFKHCSRPLSYTSTLSATRRS
eukprot:2217947-Pleurochrysis_carterae.AAC.13